MSWVDRDLEDWGAWLRTKGLGQGWGGSVDYDRYGELVQGKRSPGEYSNPTQREWEATIFDQQSRVQRVDRYISLCNLVEQTTAVLRYAGTLIPVEEPEWKDHPRWIVSRGTLEGVPARWADVEMAGEVWFRETHGLPVAEIARTMGVALGTVYDRLAMVKERVRAELAHDSRTRKNAPKREAA